MKKQPDILSPPPLFLVGAERSGTTLLRLMLDSHPQIAWCQEFEYAVDLVSDEGWPAVDTYADWLQTHRVFRSMAFDIDRSLTYPQLVNSFLIQKQTRDGKHIVGATVHRHFDRLLTIWPTAKFIHLVRDGRDVARSCIVMGWAGNVWTGVESWITAERLCEQFRQQLAADRWIDLVYEQLICEPETCLERVCRFMGTKYDPQMLEYHRTTTYDRPDPKLIHQWKRKLTPRQVGLVESRIGDMLIERGYELSGRPPAQVSLLRTLMLRIQSRWGVTRFRINRYGPWLWLMSFLSRRMPWRSWQKRVKLQINAVDAAHLK